MHSNLSGRAAELAHLTDLIRTSLSLADAAIPTLNEQLHALAEMGIDNLERFVRGLPQPLTPAAEVWINPPENRPHIRTLELPRDSKFVPQVSQSH